MLSKKKKMRNKEVKKKRLRKEKKNGVDSRVQSEGRRTLWTPIVPGVHKSCPRSVMSHQGLHCDPYWLNTARITPVRAAHLSLASCRPLSPTLRAAHLSLAFWRPFLPHCAALLSLAFRRPFLPCSSPPIFPLLSAAHILFLCFASRYPPPLLFTARRYLAQCCPPSSLLLTIQLIMFFSLGGRL